MAGFFGKAVGKIFGNKSEKDIKAVMPYVDKTNEIFTQLASLSNDELRNKTGEVKSRIDDHLKSIDEQVAGLNKKV